MPILTLLFSVLVTIMAIHLCRQRRRRGTRGGTSHQGNVPGDPAVSKGRSRRPRIYDVATYWCSNSSDRFARWNDVWVSSGGRPDVERLTKIDQPLSIDLVSRDSSRSTGRLECTVLILLPASGRPPLHGLGTLEKIELPDMVIGRICL